MSGSATTWRRGAPAPGARPTTHRPAAVHRAVRPPRQRVADAPGVLARHAAPGRREPLPSLLRPLFGGPGFRPDVEGLRAVAVTLVVLGHAGVPGVAGGYVGVDVFFVISGFLITGLLVKEVSRTGRISLGGFYARRAQRLLPASTLVVAVTLLAGRFWEVPTQWAALTQDALAATYYGTNWRLAVQGTNYLSAETMPSPLQHLWSLAVEEQFYLAWPLLVAGVWWLRRRHGGGRGRLRLVLLLVVLASLTCSVLATRGSAPWAYFGTHTRAWELAVGALVALSVGTWRRLRHRVGAIVGWLGLAAVVASGVLFDATTAFPGYAALLPVLGTAAVLAGGSTGAAGGPVVLLGTRGFRWVGGLSYAWYLWHWPVFVLGPLALGRAPSAPLLAVLALASLGLAWVSYRLVENPVRSASWFRVRSRRGLGLGLALSGALAACALLVGTVPVTVPVGSPQPDLASAVRTATDPQARLTQEIRASLGRTLSPANLTPSLTAAADDVPALYPTGCHLSYKRVRQTGRCVFGDPAGTRTVFLVGDSHAAQWYPAVQTIARAHHVRLVALTKAQCQVPDVLVYDVVLKRRYDECLTWRDWVFDRIVRERPDVVLLGSNGGEAGGLLDAAGDQVPLDAPGYDDRWLDGWRRSLDRLQPSGARLVLISDTPWPRGRAPECIATNVRRVDACTLDVEEAVRAPRRQRAVDDLARSAGVLVVEPVPWLCADGRCPAVVGNVLAYRDHSHLTVTYTRLLARPLEAALTPVLGPPVIGPAPGSAAGTVQAGP